MEPVCHTLMGVALGEAGLKRGSSLAAATLVIGANLPDLDAVLYLIGSDLALDVRRGWTHGLIGVAVLPWLLAAGMRALATIGRDRDASGGLPFRRLLVLSYIGVISHPALDWLNVYGIRLLMPFSPRWFYGDALFIVDPWMWLMLGAPLLWTAMRLVTRIQYSLQRTAQQPYSGPAALHPNALGNARRGPRRSAAKPTTPTSQGIWDSKGRALGWVLVRRHRRQATGRERLVRIALALACGYGIAMAAGSRIVERQAYRWLAAQGTAVVDVAALPVLLNPFVRDVVVLERASYEFLIFDVWSSPSFTKRPMHVPRTEPDAIVLAALKAPHVQGLRGWLRFPAYEVEMHPDGYRVEIRDLRFARLPARGFGSAVVKLDKSLRPVVE